ncbi:MAG: hypothetical protein MJ210_00825 [Alphaproteobacteria bacterium]|nr:hypothetical protein [Alphaproteobacteria bacterium]
MATLKEQKTLIVQAMLSKTKGVKDGEIIVDKTNIADVHDGAMDMFDYLDKEAEKKNEHPAPEIDIARQIIAAQIQSYDEENGLTNIKPEDEKDIEKAFDEAWKIVSEFNYEEDKNKDESGFKESYQIIDLIEFEGTPEEAKATKETFIDTIKLEAARNTAIKGKGKTGDELKAILKNELEAVSSAHLGVLATTDALADLPENATDRQRQDVINVVMDRYAEAFNSGAKVKISNASVIAYQAAMVNNHISFLNRLAGKDHLANRSAPILSKLYAPLKKIDQTCIARFSKPYEIARTFGMMAKGNMASQGLNQVLRIGCNYGALALGMPGVGNYIYTAVYAGMAISRFYKAYRDDKAGDPNFSTAKCFLQKTPEIALTAAGVAASFFGGAIAEKGLEVAVRYGMMGVGLLTSFGKGINAARKEGNGWWKSIGKAFGNAASSTGAALLAGSCLSGGLNFASTHFGFGNTHAETFSTENHKHSDVQTVDKDGIIKGTDWFGEHGTRHISADEYNPDDASYTRDIVNNPDDYKNMTPEELNSNGILQEDISADKAKDLSGISNEDLAKDGIVREIIAEKGFNPEEHPNAIKIVDEPATSEYKEGVVENAEKIVKYWTSSNPEVHQSNMAAYADENSALSQWNKTHDFKMDPNRIELIIGDCGGQMVAADVDTLTEHIDTTVPEEYRQSAIVQTIMHTYSADTEVHYTYDPERGILMMDAPYDSNAHREIPFNMNTVTMADYKSLEALIGSEAMENLKENGECDATIHSEHTESTTKETNEHAVEGNHKVFGRAWLETYGEKLGLTDDDIKAIASCHDENGKLIQEKLTPQVLEKIAIIDAFVSNNNEVGDVEATRPGAHNDGVLNRNVVIDENGRHVHSDENAQKFNTYANSSGSRQETPEKVHYEEFKQYSKVEQHSYIPFTVTFDRMWGGCKSAFNTIMGANGKRKEQINTAGERISPTSSKPVSFRSTERA